MGPNRSSSPEAGGRVTGLFPAAKILMLITGGILAGTAAAQGLHLPVPPAIHTNLMLFAGMEDALLLGGSIIQLFRAAAGNRGGFLRESHPAEFFLTVCAYDIVSTVLLSMIMPR